MICPCQATRTKIADVCCLCCMSMNGLCVVCGSLVRSTHLLEVLVVDGGEWFGKAGCKQCSHLNDK